MASKPPTKRRWAAAAALVTSLVTPLVTSLGLSALPASAAPSGDPQQDLGPVAPPGRLSAATATLAGKLAGGLERSAAGRHSVFVQLSGRGAADAAAAARSAGSPAAGETAARERRAAVSRTAAKVLDTAQTEDARAQQLFQVSNAVPGIGVSVNSAALKAIAARPDVVKVSPLVPKTFENANTAQLDRVLNTWRNLGNTGRGVRVGVIDTGLDYTHADFGGRGTVRAYRRAHAHQKNPRWRAGLPHLAKAKVAGGHDFVGDDYNADPTAPDFQPIPHPDKNPIDCGEHGTHVAGTLAGYGVTGKGRTFTGHYSKLTGRRLFTMRVGPGMAPHARLYSLKVFGCTGSTDVVIPALDWALDPNHDGNFSDHFDIVNLSLGSDYGTVDDPENTVVNAIARHGVLPVMSMGNGGDLTDIGGSPGNAVRSLAVASSVDSYQLRDGLKVNRPARLAGMAAGQVSEAYNWARNGPTGRPVTGQVVAIPGPNSDGCDALSPADAAKVKGKVAWLRWDDNDATRRCGSADRAANVKAAGAIGSIFTSSLNVFAAGITGDPDIPVFQLPKKGTDRLRPAMRAGRLNVTFNGRFVATIKTFSPAITDTISSFTSRGPHGSIGVVKPDVTAPGDTIASAKMASGTKPLVISGTSMASPHAAGIAALVKAAHPRWSPTMLKAAVMNTAGHDLFTKNNRSGHRYAPARVGAGRVDALAAVSTKVLAFVGGGVSASFGVVPAPTGKRVVRHRRTVTVRNTAGTATTVHLSYSPVVRQPGVTYSVSPSALTVGGHHARRVTVTMTVRPGRLRHTIDPTMQRRQLGVPRQFVSDASGRLLVTPAGGHPLRVPVYGAAKPVSRTTASAGPTSIRLRGPGISQGKGPNAYRSLVSVLELGDRSDKVPVCAVGQVGGCTYNQSSKAGDLRLVGAGSSGKWLWFGIASYGDWATIGNSIIPFVDFDTTGGSSADFEAFVSNLPGTDVLVSQLVDLDTKEVVDIEPVNFNFGNVDTNVFDNNVLLIPVLKSKIGAPTTDKKFPITYDVGMADTFTGADIDNVTGVDFDAGRPAVQTGAPLFRDRNGVAIGYTLGSSAESSGAEAMVVHLHGQRGHRARVVKLPPAP